MPVVDPAIQAVTDRHRSSKGDADSAKSELLASQRAPGSLLLLRQLECLATCLDRTLQEEFDLSLWEFALLDVLKERPLGQSQLCQRTGRSAAAISRWLKRLKAENCVSCNHPAHDRREVVATITRRGLNQHRGVRDHLAQTLRQMTNDLPPEAARLLPRLLTNLRQVANPSPAATPQRPTRLSQGASSRLHPLIRYSTRVTKPS